MSAPPHRLMARLSMVLVAVVVALSWPTAAYAILVAGQAEGLREAFDDPKWARETRASNVVVGGAAPGEASAKPGPTVVAPTVPAVAPKRELAPSVLAANRAPPVTSPPVAPQPVVPTPLAPPPIATGPARAASPAAPPPARKQLRPPMALAARDAGTHGGSESEVSAAAAAPTPAVLAKPIPSQASIKTAAGPWPYAPRMKLSYRRFPFTSLGAVSTTTPATLGPGTPQSFESLSLDLYPISWFLRVGLSTQFGWQSGQFDRTGDYFIAETASVGFQIPGRWTPFAEALAGAGYMRRKQAEGSLPTAYWQVGIDAGVEIYFAKRAYASVALGYLHPANIFVIEQSLMSVKANTWSLKFGLGI